MKTLRQLEAQSLDLQMPGFSPLHRRLPDTTVYELLGRLAPDELLGTLVAQVRTLWRSKLLAPLGLPCGVIAIDGKSLGALDHDADGWGQRHARDHDGSPYWLVRALRAVLTSSVGRPRCGSFPSRRTPTRWAVLWRCSTRCAPPTMRCLKSSPSMPA